MGEQRHTAQHCIQIMMRGMCRGKGAGGGWLVAQPGTDFHWLRGMIGLVTFLKPSQDPRRKVMLTDKDILSEVFKDTLPSPWGLLEQLGVSQGSFATGTLRDKKVDESLLIQHRPSGDEAANDRGNQFWGTAQNLSK